MPAVESRREYYHVLGVSPEATPEEIKRAYRRRLCETHPGLRPFRHDPLVCRRVHHAYEVLSNPAERRRYDTLTGLRRHAGKARVHRRSYVRLFECLKTPTPFRIELIVQAA